VSTHRSVNRSRYAHPAHLAHPARPRWHTRPGSPGPRRGILRVQRWLRDGVLIRILQRILALTAAIWHNDHMAVGCCW